MTGSAIDEIGGPFALGQWLADNDPFFKDHWITWCSQIQSVNGFAQDTSVTVEAIVEVVRDNEVEKQDRKLVFRYTGPGVVSPLQVSVEGEDLLEQAHDMITASQSVEASHAPHLPAAEVSAVTLPTIESGVIRVSPVVHAPSIPVAHSGPVLPQGTANPDVVPPKTVAEVRTFIPALATSATTLPSAGAKSSVVVLPEIAPPIVTVTVIKEPAPEAVPLPSAKPSKSEVINLPAPESTVAPITIPKAEAVAALPKPTRDAIVNLPETTDDAGSAIPQASEADAGAALPKPTRDAIVNLPETTKDAVPVIPQHPASETTLPSAGRPVPAGQYLVPIDPFPSDFSGGETLAQAIERVVGKDVMPQAVSDVLGHLKVRKGFVAVSDRFKGLVLEVEMDSPIPALVRLSLAKEKDVWAFGGEVLIARSAAEDGTPRPPLIFTLKIASSSTAKSLVMALEGEVNLIDDLFRPMFGDFTIPDSIGLTVKNPVLVIVRKDESTKALVGVSLAMGVDFGELPFVGEAIKAEGDAKLSLGIQYASGPFLAPDIAEINSVLSSELQFAPPESGTLEGLKLAASLQMTGKPLLLSIPLGGGKASDQDQLPSEYCRRNRR